MCIAILKPKDKILSKELLKTCSDNNKDGCGFAYCNKGTVFINKYMDFEDFYKDYKKVENKSNMLIHFRIATHGKVEVDNCHPFKLNNRMALIHNGVISGYGVKESKPDTVDFIEKVIGNISYKMWNNPSFRTLVGDAIGYSKLAILDKSGKYFIINEDKGEWVDGVWFSNNSYKSKTYSYSYTSNTKKTTEIHSTEDYPAWDYSGSETYDEWYDKWYKWKNKKDNKQDTTINNKDVKENKYETDEDYKFIYKCSKCGNEFTSTDYVTPPCDVCHAQGKDIEEVGCEYNGAKYYYEEYEKEIKNDTVKV